MEPFKDAEIKRVRKAAYFPNRITKQLVDQTEIGSVVDKILVKVFPVSTYRELGFLLFGLVRIYAKKVEYMLVDCNHSQSEMKFFTEGRKKADVNYGGMCLPESSSQRSQHKIVDVNSSESSKRKKSYSFVDSMRAQFSSISLPDHFDLDAYDLEIVEDTSSDDHVRPHLELVLHDTWENHRTLSHTLSKDIASASTSSAMITNINQDTSVENFRHRFVLEECLDPMVLGESDDELVLDSVPLTEQEQESEGINDMEFIETMSEDAQNPDEECTTTGQIVVSEMTSVDNIMLEPSPNKSQLSVTVGITPQSKAPVVSAQRKSGRVAVRTPASRENVRAPRKRKPVYDHAVAVLNEVYESWVSDASDLVRKRRTWSDVRDRKEPRSSDYFTQPQISSSALESRSLVTLNKQVITEGVEETVGPTPLKADVIAGEIETEVVAPEIFDDAGDAGSPLEPRSVVTPNEQVITEVEEETVDPTPLKVHELAKERRGKEKAFGDRGGTWSDVHDRKERPQISIDAGSPLEPRSVVTPNEQVITEGVEETVDPTPLKVHALAGEIEAEVFAPQTPATNPDPTALWFDDVFEPSTVSPMRMTSSSSGGRNAVFPNRGMDVSAMQGGEGPSSLGEGNQENVLVAEKLSAETKSVGGYLHRNLVQRTKKGEGETVKLSQLLTRRTKTESAKYFYQMLVLKTGGYIDVNQEKPYDEIFVKQTQKLEKVFGGRSRE